MALLFWRACRNQYVYLGARNGNRRRGDVHHPLQWDLPQIPAATTITGSAIAANPGGATVTSIKISTNATSGTATAKACTIEHVYKVRPERDRHARQPVPVYAATFRRSRVAQQRRDLVPRPSLPDYRRVILDTLTGRTAPAATGGISTSTAACATRRARLGLARTTQPGPRSSRQIFITSGLTTTRAPSIRRSMRGSAVRRAVRQRCRHRRPIPARRLITRRSRPH